MKKLLITLLFFCFILSGTAFATQPCSAPSKKEFVEHTLKPSDLIVIGEILSSQKKHATNIKIIKTFYSKNTVPLPKKLLISKWSAYSPPLFYAKKGEKRLFYIKKEGELFYISNLSWKDCVPGISPVYTQYGIVKGYKEEASSQSKFFSEDEFSRFIKNNL